MLFPLVLSFPSVCIRDNSFRMRQMIFLYFTKWNNHLTTCCNVTIYTIDTFSDPFPRGQWWVQLPKITCMRTQRRYRRERQTRFAVQIAAIFLSRSVCTVTNKAVVSTSFFRVAYGYHVLSVRTLDAYSDWTRQRQIDDVDLDQNDYATRSVWMLHLINMFSKTSSSCFTPSNNCWRVQSECILWGSIQTGRVSVNLTA